MRIGFYRIMDANGNKVLACQCFSVPIASKPTLENLENLYPVPVLKSIKTISKSRLRSALKFFSLLI
jgi:hypothetical protein